MRILAISDTHRNTDQMMMLKDRVFADLYLHAGDSCQMESLISPYLSVKGNCDSYPYPKFRVIPINEKLNLYLAHGNIFGNTKKYLYNEALKYNCQIVIYGHTHIPDVDKIANVYLINPGSLDYPRSKAGRTYALIDINEKDKVTILPKIIYLDGEIDSEKN